MMRDNMENGLLLGTAHDNQILDMRRYEVGFEDDHMMSLVAPNAFGENLFSHIDTGGNDMHVLLF